MSNAKCCRHYNRRSILDYSMRTAAGVPQSQADGAAAFAHSVPSGCARQLADADQAQDGVVLRTAEQAQAKHTDGAQCTLQYSSAAWVYTMPQSGNYSTPRSTCACTRGQSYAVSCTSVRSTAYSLSHNL